MGSRGRTPGAPPRRRFPRRSNGLSSRTSDADFRAAALNAVLANRFFAQPSGPDGVRSYARWRERKLALRPRGAEELVVELRDARDPSAAELAEIRRRCAIANMAVYASPRAAASDKDIPRILGERLGLGALRTNPLADEDGISSLETRPEKSALGYIPYSNRRLLWHTDGYYNAPEERIRAFILHCARPAASGGENRLLDPDLAYILLRDADPAYIEALSAPDAMTIPANSGEGTAPRPARSGPVFSDDGGALHMRYTARTRSIEWARGEALRAAVAFLQRTLDGASEHVLSVRLAPGQGLVCNNVLHDRSAFADDPAPGAGRLVFRARYSRRVEAP